MADLNKELGKRNLAISNGYGKLKEQTFRIAHMGDLQMSDIDELLGAINDILKLKVTAALGYKQLFVLQSGIAATILERMEEQKACLFCGKIVDGTYQYCPHCGYEFGEGEELSALLDETMGDSSGDGETGLSASPPHAPGPPVGHGAGAGPHHQDLFKRSLMTLRSSSSELRLLR